MIDFYANGKRHREKVEGGLTKVRAELEKRRKAGRDSTFVPQNKLTKYTMQDLIEKYKKLKWGKNYFEKTEVHYIDMIGNYFNGRKLISIRAEDFDLFMNDRMSVLKKDDKPRSNCCINREVALLRHILNKAVYWDMLEINPYHKFSNKRMAENENKVFLEEEKRNVILEPEQLDDITPHCRTYLRNIIYGLLYTGLRVRDLLTLKWEDINWEKRSFTLLNERKVEMESPKR